MNENKQTNSLILEIVNETNSIFSNVTLVENHLLNLISHILNHTFLHTIFTTLFFLNTFTFSFSFEIFVVLISFFDKPSQSFFVVMLFVTSENYMMNFEQHLTNT